MPKAHHKNVKDILVMIGGIYPLLMIQGVINLEKPYPHTFLLMVTETKIEPATGLYESTAYVEAMAGRAATWMPIHV